MKHKIKWNPYAFYSLGGNILYMILIVLVTVAIKWYVENEYSAMGSIDVESTSNGIAAAGIFFAVVPVVLSIANLFFNSNAQRKGLFCGIFISHCLSIVLVIVSIVLYLAGYFLGDFPSDWLSEYGSWSQTVYIIGIVVTAAIGIIGAVADSLWYKFQKKTVEDKNKSTEK